MKNSLTNNGSSVSGKKQRIGLFGFGVVGESLYNVIKGSPSSNAEVCGICVKDPHKARSLPAEKFCSQPQELIQHPEINLVVELINDEVKALEIVKKALSGGKNVVSGNKKMLARNIKELIELQHRTGQGLLYDASACGSIPVIRNLEEYYDNDLLLSITGILNGSSNYILSKISQHHLPYSEALSQAQEAGFAEKDPADDVEGHDSVYKLVLLTLHGFGTIAHPDNVFRSGIQNLDAPDIRFANERGFRIKLVAQAQKYNGNQLALFVMPKLVSRQEYIFNVEDEYNGVVIEGQYYEKQFMFGKGAGGYPTGSAVLSDITAFSHNYRYEYKKLNYFSEPETGTDLLLEVYYRYNQKEQIDLLDFESINERYSGPGYYYVTGTIRLYNLMKARQAIARSKVFLAFFRILL